MHIRLPAAIVFLLTVHATASAQGSGELVADLLTQVQNLHYELKVLRDENERLQHEVEKLWERNHALVESIEKKIGPLEPDDSEKPSEFDESESELDEDIVELDEDTGDTLELDELEEPDEFEEPESGEEEASESEPAVSDSETARPEASPDKKDLVEPFESTQGSEKEKEIYMQAIQNLNEGDFNQMQLDLEEFLSHYSKGPYVARANYMLGEFYYNEGIYSRAIEYFKRVIEEFPDSDKFDSARLKLAYVHYERGNLELARALFETLLSTSDADIKRLASEQIRYMDSQEESP